MADSYAVKRFPSQTMSQLSHAHASIMGKTRSIKKASRSRSRKDDQLSQVSNQGGLLSTQNMQNTRANQERGRHSGRGHLKEKQAARSSGNKQIRVHSVTRQREVSGQEYDNDENEDEPEVNLNDVQLQLKDQTRQPQISNPSRTHIRQVSIQQNVINERQEIIHKQIERQLSSDEPDGMMQEIQQPPHTDRRLISHAD